MRHCQSLHVLCSHRPHVHGEGPWRVMVAMTGCSVTSRHLGGLVINTQIPLHVQVQAEQALQNITAAMEQASGHRQEAAVLKNKLAADQVSLSTACVYVFAYTHTHESHWLLVCTATSFHECLLHTNVARRKGACQQHVFTPRLLLSREAVLCACSPVKVSELL